MAKKQKKKTHQKNGKQINIKMANKNKKCIKNDNNKQMAK